ncbi:MAG: hypothetical protein MRY79_07935 [Alphaproteobacteria bacterium]|nr:hypothetical protein [Alphaproteobacteria bacterium]
MSGFGRLAGRGNELEGNAKAETINATVRDIKASPEKGCKRLIVQEKGTHRKPCAIDLDMKQLSKVKRKEDYSFIVEEKTEDRYGGGSGARRNSTFKRYYCDQSPEKYHGSGGSGNGFKDFSGSGRLNSSGKKGKGSSGRTQF